jgi:hypothetical protein
MKTVTAISFAIALMSSGCDRQSDKMAPRADETPTPPARSSREFAYLAMMQLDADMMADAHMKLYEAQPSDNSDQSVVARLMLLILLDGYQEKKARLEAPPINYTYISSRAADVAAFLQSHAEERKQLQARLKEAKEEQLKEGNPTDAPSAVPLPRVRVIK